MAGLKVRGQVESLVTPVGQIAPGRSVPHAVPVYIEDEPVVGADPDRIGSGYGRQIHGAPEMKDDRFAQWCRRVGDPTGLPFMMGRVGLEGALGEGTERPQGEQEGE